MRYHFLNERTCLLRTNNGGSVILSYIYRDIDTLLADGFEFCTLVTDCKRVRGKTHNTVYRLYWLSVDACTAVYALLDNTIPEPLIKMHDTLWYTCCDAADIVTTVMTDMQLMRFYRETLHGNELFYSWRKTHRCYGLYCGVIFVTQCKLSNPVHVSAYTQMCVQNVHVDTVTFVYSNKKFDCVVTALPAMRLQRLLKGDFKNGYYDI